jgi:hypothetical protein
MQFGSSGLEPVRPFSSLIAGVGAGEQIQTDSLKRQVLQTGLDRARDERAALKTYANTGEGKDLLAASPDMWMKLNEDQRKEMESGMKAFKEQAPFLTPENYAGWAANYQKQHPNLGKLLPPPQQMQTPEQIGGFVTKANKAVTSLYEQKTAIDTAAKEEQYKKIQLPAMKLENEFKTKLYNLQATKQLDLQKNAQEFAHAENKEKLKLDREMKEAKTTETREGHFYTNLRFEQSKLNETLLKGIEKIGESYTGPEKDAKELELRRSHSYINNQILKKYKTWADEYKIPFQELPDESGGKAAGTQYMLPSRDDPNKMIPATKEQYNAWHGIK